jgi:uncharacterized protein (DUF169 family)
MTDFAASHARLEQALQLTRPPVAICLCDQVPDGVEISTEAVPAGCAFWERAARGPVATKAADHELCAIGVHTHNLTPRTPALESELATALAVMGELDYVRPEEVAALPIVPRAVSHVIYAPLSRTPAPPDVVLLFTQARQGLVVSEAVARVDEGMAPAMGRPACAVVPQAIRSGRAALSLGCCGARAYLDALTDDVALWALPGDKLERYVDAIASLARSNDVLATFHQLRRRDVSAGQRPSYAESLARLQQQEA